MNKELIDIRVECAKSWFFYAQLCMILAGFLFASSGIAWQNIGDNLRDSTNAVYFGVNRIDKILLDAQVVNSSINHSIISEYLNMTANFPVNITAQYAILLEVNSKLWIVFFVGGFIFTLLSFIFCIIGKGALKKLEQVISKESLK